MADYPVSSIEIEPQNNNDDSSTVSGCIGSKISVTTPKKKRKIQKQPQINRSVKKIPYQKQ